MCNWEVFFKILSHICIILYFQADVKNEVHFNSAVILFVCSEVIDNDHNRSFIKSLITGGLKNGQYSESVILAGFQFLNFAR